jgi:hypothetical protein
MLDRLRPTVKKTYPGTATCRVFMDLATRRAIGLSSRCAMSAPVTWTALDRSA